MKLYTIFITITLAITLGINIVIDPFNVYNLIILLVVGIVFEMAIDAIVAFVVHKLPEKWMNPNSVFFRVYKFERKIYEKLGIKKWKDLVPETGQLCDFKKNKIKYPNDSQYLYKFLVETCYAELMHFLCVFLSFFVLFIGKGKLIFTMCIPMAIINAMTQLLPAIIQRYVRPRITILYNRALKIEQENKVK